jgi:peptide/nickel transport system permease protein
MAILTRQCRETLNVNATDYMRTARKRLPARLVYLRHAFPNAVPH